MQNGLQNLLAADCAPLFGQRVGLIVNHTSVGKDLQPSYSHILQQPKVDLRRIFSPEHGLWGIAQDQEKVETVRDKQTGLEIVSLYGKQLAPSEEMLKDLDIVVFDIQDIGVRYYTYIYTMLLAMQICSKLTKRFMILDRPNPLGGRKREGNILEQNYSSFVGLYPLPVVHGLTVGELARYSNINFQINCALEIIPCDDWQRRSYFDETDLIWIAPSPNMPSIQTALVYAGSCLFEATNISEGRGTTQPFEVVGAPWIDPWEWWRKLAEFDLPGVQFRPLYYRPRTNKYANQDCGGVQIHVTDREQFRSYQTGLTMIKAAYELYPGYFAWKQPPYEFEEEKLPIDILTGTASIREHIEQKKSINQLVSGWDTELRRFEDDIEPYLMYPS